MEIIKIVPLYLLLISHASGYTSTLFHPSQKQSAGTGQYDLPNFASRRSPKQHQLTFPSSSFIKSTFPQNESEPQLFNVGYSVRFEYQRKQAEQQAQQAQQQKQILAKKGNQGEIITGTRKQNVQVDIPGNEEHAASFQVQKTLPKPKRLISQASQNTVKSFNAKSISTQANFSPQTQKHLQALENLKEADPQLELSKLFKQKYTWRNLSPNVKIIRSTELPLPTDNIENRALVFDHAKALSKSEGFGFSDAIREENAQSGEKGEIKYEKLPSSLPLENFRIIQVADQNREPSVQIKVANDQEEQKLKHEKVVLNITPKAPTQHQQKVKSVQVIPANLFQAVEGTPLKLQHSKHEKLTQPHSKRVIGQFVKIPRSHYDASGKVKYFTKQFPGRVNSVQTRKAVPAGLDFSRNSRIKPEIRREFKIPHSEYGMNSLNTF